MKLREVKVMRGPNYWAPDCNKSVVLKIDLDNRDRQQGNAQKVLSAFNKYLDQQAPGFTLDTGASENSDDFAAVAGQIAIRLQEMAEIDVSYTRSQHLIGDKWAVSFEYATEEAGRIAGEKAVDLINSILDGTPFDLSETVEQLKEFNGDDAPGPSTLSIINEAASRGIPYRVDDEYSLVRLGYGCGQKIFRATVMQTTSDIGVELAASKSLTKKLLSDNGISVPDGIEVEDIGELIEAVERLGTPVVVKPLDGNHGRGVTADIDDPALLTKAFAAAKKVSDTIIVEKHIAGDDYRLLVVNYAFVAAAKRTPPFITGDGHSTVEELVAVLNNNPERGDGHQKNLTFVDIDAHTTLLLEEQGLTAQSVLPAGRTIALKRTANLSSGGTAEDVTRKVHPSIKSMAERIARLMHLDVCGIDLVITDISQPLTRENGAVIEVNAGPGFRMHTHPSEGMPINVAKPVVDMLFPDNGNGRIPLVAVTGTNGKTTVVRLMAHIAQHAQNRTGFTTTEGIYIDGELVVEGDCSGPKSAAVVLNDPAVEFAVLECARGGILRSGLAFDRCNVSIVTNVTEDHLGLDDVYTLEEYAKVKAVIPASTMQSGTAVLNADDDLVYAMKSGVSCPVILFSTNPENERVARHCSEGGQAVIVKNNRFVLKKSGSEQEIVAVTDVPITQNGSALFMVKNVLAAIGGSVASGFSPATIADALQQFYASPETTPGRMNLFNIGGVSVMLDYAHNAGGYNEIAEYMKSVQKPRKVGVIAATGDRKKDDIIRLGKYAGEIFTEIVIRHDKDSRGSDNEDLTALLKEGIFSANPSIAVTVISDEEEALRHAIGTADEGTFVFASADKVFRSIEILKKLGRESENKAVA